MPTFVHGKGTGVLVDEFDLSAYFNQVAGSRTVQAVHTTTFGSDNKSYIPGIEEGSMSVQGLWDGSAAAVDEIFDAAVGAESVMTVCPQGLATLGNSAVMMKGENITYNIRSTVTDAVRVVIGGKADGGVRTAGRLLHVAGNLESSTSAESSVDGAASSAFGGVAHLHVLSASASDTIDVVVEHSANDSTWATLATFTQANNETSQRVAVTGTVNRYLRASWTIAGSGPSFDFVVAFARNRK